MDKAGIAVVGVGLVGFRRAEEIRRSRSAALAGIVDVAPKAAAVARDAGVIPGEAEPLVTCCDRLQSLRVTEAIAAAAKSGGAAAVWPGARP
jgi:hypothetical protein